MRGHIRKRGRNSWELKFEVAPINGKRQTRTQSFRGTLREAKDELAKLLAKVADGEHVAPNKVTVGAYLRERIGVWRAMGTISAKPAERFQQYLRHQIEPHLGSKLVQRLTTKEVEAWHAKLLTEGRHDGKGGLATRTIKDAHKLLSKALDEAVRHQLVPKNVCILQPPPRVVSQGMHILSPEQVAGFVTLLKAHPEFLAPAVVALFTGMRRGEVLALQWGDVDFGTKVIKVRRSLVETDEEGVKLKSPKTKAGVRDITLPDVVIETLQEHRKRLLELRLQLGLGKLKDTDVLFSDLEGRPKLPDSFSSAWSELSRKLKLGISFHELRHTHASQLIDADVDVVTISRRLGHAHPGITLSTYAHLFRKDDSKAADAINTVLGRR
jgi:integrase